MTQTIHRATRRDRFVIVDQKAVEDARLSWAARGLLAYLLSRPDDWKVLVNDLRKRGNLGRDGIYTLLRELREAGYMRFERHRDRLGRVRGGIYIVSEIPHTGLPEVDDPTEAEPRSARTRALPNTEETKNTTTTPRQTDTYHGRDAEKKACKFRLPDWIREEVHEAVEHLVAELEPDHAQLVIDEWVGALDEGAVVSSPLGYLKTMAKRWQQGDMTLRYAGSAKSLLYEDDENDELLDDAEPFDED